MGKFDILTDAVDSFYVFASYDLEKTARKGESKNFIFPKTHPKVKDDKDHFPLSSLKQGRAALGYANHFKEAPPWWSGTLQQLVSAVAKAVKKEFPSIDVSKASKKPGKG